MTTQLPEFIRPWTAPFHVTMDGIKDDKGCWICSAANNKLAHEMVELMNFAAAAGKAMETAETALSEMVEDRLYSDIANADQAMLKEALVKIRTVISPWTVEHDFKGLIHVKDELGQIAITLEKHASGTPGSEIPVDRHARSQHERALRIAETQDINTP